MATEGRMLKSIKVKRAKDAPVPLIRGSSAVDTENGKCYFISEESEDVRMYDVEKDDWTVLRKCPYHDPSLVVLDGLLTAVGGRKRDENNRDQFSNKLISLSNRRWIEKFPAMPVDPALGVDSRGMLPGVAKHGNTLLVLGSQNPASDPVKKSRMLDLETSEWTELCDLPDRLYNATTVICGDEVFSVGGSVWRRVFQCFFDELVDSSKSTGDVWNSIADLPYVKATCTSLCGQLVAVGGWGEAPNNKMVNTISAYDPNKDEWYTIGKLALPRTQPHVLRLSEDTLLVVGGHSPNGQCILAEVITGVTA